MKVKGKKVKRIGVTGVTYDRSMQKFRARLNSKHIGFYDEEYAAIYARLEAERDLGIEGVTSASLYIDKIEGCERKKE